MKKLILFFAMLLFAVHPAYADDYIKPSWPDLLHSLIRFNALDVTDNTLLDEYAVITECKLYKAFYTDDFKWSQVRAALRDSIQQSIATYPTAYGYVTDMQLDRYDFDRKIFPFTAKTSVRNVNAITLYRVEQSTCEDGRGGFVKIHYLPMTYRLALDTPIYISGLSLTQKDADTLLLQMKADGNVNRDVYARFNIRISYIDPLQKNYQHGASAVVTYTQLNNPVNDQKMRIDARLDSVDFFEDADLTKLISTYRP